MIWRDVSLDKSDQKDPKRRDLRLTKIVSKSITFKSWSEHVYVAVYYDELTLGVKC